MSDVSRRPREDGSRYAKAPAPGIRWAGEFQWLRNLGETEAFAALLTSLGYRPDNFRVTVRRITGDGRKVIRYNVFVDQLRDGQPFRGKVYLGGHDEKWIDQFALRASVDFPQA
jgi:hypothetical protein